MQIKPDEISSLIKERIKKYEKKMTLDDVGTVIQNGDGGGNNIRA